MKNIFTSLILAVLLCACTNSSKQNIPIAIEELSIEGIHKSYSNREYTSEALVEAYLDRITKLDSSTNSITYINPEALLTAKKLDQEFEKTAVLRPLHGIPLIVKDNINVVGMPTTAGSFALENYYPTQDAFIIQQLKEAGAIILAKSNMAEWAFSPMHTESSTHGITRNPYNLAYVPAGSSGGTAAAVAANFGTIGLGTDTGNSIRGPSSHCSLVGFRTTLGLISRSGIVPLFLRNDVVGPMCRTVTDATKIMEIMVGYDSLDDITQYSRGKMDDSYQKHLIKNGLEGARIGVLSALVDDTSDPEIKNLFNKALQDLERLGAEIINPVTVENFEALSQNQWCGTFKKDVESFLSENVKADSLRTIEDIISAGTKSEFARQRLAGFANSSEGLEEDQTECGNAYTDLKSIAFRKAIRQVMDSLQLDAIIYPSWKNRPAALEEFELQYKGDNSQIISPHTGQPAFTVPMGYLSNNLPVGIQFLGRMYDEGTLIKLSYSYEQGTKHRKAPDLE